MCSSRIKATDNFAFRVLLKLSFELVAFLFGKLKRIVNNDGIPADAGIFLLLQENTFAAIMSRTNGKFGEITRLNPEC